MRFFFILTASSCEGLKAHLFVEILDNAVLDCSTTSDLLCFVGTSRTRSVLPFVPCNGSLTVVYQCGSGCDIVIFFSGLSHGII